MRRPLEYIAEKEALFTEKKELAEKLRKDLVRTTVKLSQARSHRTKMPQHCHDREDSCRIHVKGQRQQVQRGKTCEGCAT